MNTDLHKKDVADLQVGQHLSIQTVLDYQALSGSNLFHQLDRASVLSILSKLRRDRWSRGYVYSFSNNFSPRFFIVIKGRVKVCGHHTNSGRELTLFLHGPGEGFNVLNLIDGGLSGLSIHALEEVELLSAPVETWIEWLDQYPVLRSSMAEVAAKQIKQLTEFACELALDDTMTRLIHLLLKYFNDDSQSGVNLIQDLSQEELANMIGTVRPVVARLLGELKRDGLIDTQGGVIHVSDLNRLLARVENHLVNPEK